MIGTVVDIFVGTAAGFSAGSGSTCSCPEDSSAKNKERSLVVAKTAMWASCDSLIDGLRESCCCDHPLRKLLIVGGGVAEWGLNLSDKVTNGLSGLPVLRASLVMGCQS